MIFKVRYNCPLISKSITRYLIMFVQWHRKRMVLFLQMAECQMCVRIWNIQREELTHWKRLWCWEGLGAGGEGENEMAGWHHCLDGREFEWTPGVGDGQGGLVCCDSWGRKESDTTEWLNWTEEDIWPKLPKTIRFLENKENLETGKRVKFQLQDE